MLLALFTRPSPQFEELFELPNQELLDPEGSHDDEPELIAGNQWDEEPEGNQLDEEWEDEENSVDPSTTPTPTPMPNTASTVEIG